MAEPQYSPTRSGHPLLGRRAVLKGALAGVTAPTLASLLAACGGGSGGGSPGGSSAAERIPSPDNPIRWDLSQANPAIKSGLMPERGSTLRIYNYADYLSPRVM